MILNDLFDEQAANSTVEQTAFSAYAIQDPLAETLAAAFKGHVPPVSGTIAVSHDEQSGKAIDRATGKPIKLFSVRIRQLSSEHAYIGAGWWIATLDGEWFGYDLQLVNGNWVIKHRTVAGVP